MGHFGVPGKIVNQFNAEFALKKQKLKNWNMMSCVYPRSKSSFLIRNRVSVFYPQVIESRIYTCDSDAHNFTGIRWSKRARYDHAQYML